MNIQKVLTPLHPLYTGEIYDSQMADPKKKLSNGTVYFMFTAEWKNGTVKQDLVSVRIVNDVFGAYDFFRSN
uniref:Uncharacterized protein n=2 Tax=Aeromonas sp. Ne-1 TaxID=1675689 RepID=A0A0H4J9J1_9GAMM|nr:hypothetical protein [Aeromonas sp. Ne-1]